MINHMWARILKTMVPICYASSNLFIGSTNSGNTFACWLGWHTRKLARLTSESNKNHLKAYHTYHHLQPIVQMILVCKKEKSRKAKKYWSKEAKDQSKARNQKNKKQNRKKKQVTSAVKYIYIHMVFLK